MISSNQFQYQFVEQIFDSQGNQIGYVDVQQATLSADGTIILPLVRGRSTPWTERSLLSIKRRPRLLTRNELHASSERSLLI
jgi:hypothetical protein